MQYTMRNVPPVLDRVLRRKARERGASLNEVVLEALARGAGVTGEPVRYRNLRDLAGTWLEDSDFDEALQDQHGVDPALWR